MTQLELPTGESLRDAGTKQVLSRNEEYRHYFNIEANWILRMIGSVTSEDVTERLWLNPTHVNCIGAAMRAFAKQHGLVVKNYYKATRPSAHARTLAVWGKP